MKVKNEAMKIILRALKLDDWNYFAKWWHDPELISMTSGNPEKFSDAAIKKQVQEMVNDASAHHWLIKIDNRVVGHINLCQMTKSKAELQIVIGEKEYWGRGIGKKAIALVLANAKKLNYKEIYVEARPENLRARKLYKSVGFIEQGVKKYRNKYLPEVVMMVKKYNSY